MTHLREVCFYILVGTPCIRLSDTSDLSVTEVKVAVRFR